MTSAIGGVPLTTRILTERGWLTHDVVRVGDRTIGYDPVSGCSRWTVVRQVFRRNDCAMLRVGNASWHATAADDHLWWSDSRYKAPVDPGVTCHTCERTFTNARGRQVHANKVHGALRARPSYENRVELVATGYLRNNCRIRVAGQAETCGVADLSIDETRVVAWLLGDGHVRRAADGTVVWAAVYQSKAAMIDKIRDLLADMPHSESRRQRNAHHLAAHTFVIGVRGVRELFRKAQLDDGGVVGFVSRLDPAQRSAFVDSMIDAEGNRQRSPNERCSEFIRITQRDGDVQDAIKLAVFLEGYDPSVSRLARRSQTTPPPRTSGCDVRIGQSACSALLGRWDARRPGACAPISGAGRSSRTGS